MRPVIRRPLLRHGLRAGVQGGCRAERRAGVRRLGGLGARLVSAAAYAAGLCCVIAVGAALVSGCASQTRLPLSLRKTINQRHVGNTVELRHSCYYGDLYDENEKWLLSPYPFAETSHIVDTKGVPIHPQRQVGILAAGTRFVLERIEFPDFKAMTMRMLTSPRYHTWVYLTPAADNASAPRDRHYFILLLPMDLDSEALVEQALARAVAPAGEVSGWLAGVRPTVRVAVEHKDAIAGMGLRELIASCGEPQRWYADENAEGRVRVAWYPSREMWLRDETIVDIRPARSPQPANRAPSPDALKDATTAAGAVGGIPSTGTGTGTGPSADNSSGSSPKGLAPSVQSPSIGDASR